MSFHPRTRFRERLSRLEADYALPAQTFIREMFDEWPLATVVLGIFAASSITPVVFTAALAVFTLFLSFSTCLIVLLGLALLLAVVLTSSLVFSAAVALLGAAVLRRRRLFLNGATNIPISETETEPEASEASSSAYTHRRRGFRVRFGSRSRRSLKFGWKPILGALLLLHLIRSLTNIRLPRVVRYSLLYRSLFGGFGSRLGYGHPSTQRTLMHSLILVPARIFWRTTRPRPVLVCLVVFFALSPRLRRVARRAGSRVYTRIAESEMAQVPWKAYASTTLETAQELAHTGLVVSIEFLKAQMQALESMSDAKPSAAATVAEAEDPGSGAASSSEEQQDATYEMVSPVQAGGVPVQEDVTIPGGSGGTTLSSSLEKDGFGIRARNLGVRSEDD